ncbi:MAG TPA: NUDIX hydrolase [Negativicutes bacterium]|nr:NUDIX hydrolase [Negativicutes bacterium]
MQKGIDYIGIAVAFFCHDGKGNVLMSKRSAKARDEHGKWDIGAGGIEIGQTVEETLQKEIKEEYCTDIIKSDFLGYRTVFREHNGQKTHWIMFDFKVQVNPDMVSNGEPHKFDELKWFAFGAMPAPGEMHSQIPNFIKVYKEKLFG